MNFFSFMQGSKNQDGKNINDFQYINQSTYLGFTPDQKELSHIVDKLEQVENYDVQDKGIRIDPYLDTNNKVIDNHKELGNKKYNLIVIETRETNGTKYHIYRITDDFRSFCSKLNYNPASLIQFIFGHVKHLNYIVKIFLLNPNTTGGKKAVVKYTVKQLQAIASKNNIKITKKVDGKTVRLNKQGLIAKLKRYKLI
uniref:Uncharacterized protein n=1 Tax=viral metagenome TaxID=1070528 RepID=A0A6C0LLN5_9ZZZZ